MLHGARDASRISSALGAFEDVQRGRDDRGGGVELRYELAPIHPVDACPVRRHRRRRRASTKDGCAAPSSIATARRRRPAARGHRAPGRRRAARRGYLHARVTPRLESSTRPSARRSSSRSSRARGRRSARSRSIGAARCARARAPRAAGHAPGAPYQPEAGDAHRRLPEERRDAGSTRRGSPRSAVRRRGSRRQPVADVTPGPRVRVVFTGDPLPADERDELVPIAREGSVDEDLLEDSSNRIEDYLHAQGYRDAMALASAQRGPTASWSSPSPIERGPQYRCRRSRARPATQSLPTRNSQPGCACGAGQPFVGARLDADVAAIEELYRRRGFASAEVVRGRRAGRQRRRPTPRGPSPSAS